MANDDSDSVLGIIGFNIGESNPFEPDLPLDDLTKGFGGGCCCCCCCVAPVGVDTDESELKLSK